MAEMFLGAVIMLVGILFGAGIVRSSKKEE